MLDREGVDSPAGVAILGTEEQVREQLGSLADAGATFLIAVPGADDIMLNYQTTSFHDALYVREALGLKPAPEFEQWLLRMQIMDEQGSAGLHRGLAPGFAPALARVLDADSDVGESHPGGSGK